MAALPRSPKTSRGRIQRPPKSAAETVASMRVAIYPKPLRRNTMETRRGHRSPLNRLLGRWHGRLQEVAELSGLVALQHRTNMEKRALLAKTRLGARYVRRCRSQWQSQTSRRPSRQRWKTAQCNRNRAI